MHIKVSKGRFIQPQAPVADGKGAVARVTVANVSERDGSTVVQIYVGDDTSSVARPVRELKSFAKAALAAGESRTLEFALSPRDFAFYDTGAGAWQVEPGRFTIWAGFSATDLPCVAELNLEGARLGR